MVVCIFLISGLKLKGDDIAAVLKARAAVGWGLVSILVLRSFGHTHTPAVVVVSLVALSRPPAPRAAAIAARRLWIETTR